MPPLCTHCYAGPRPSDRFCQDETDSAYFAGEVFSIRESVFTPIENIFASPEVSSLAGSELLRSQESLLSLCTRRESTLKLRPGILTKDILNPLHNPRGAVVCLMATFEGTPMEELPYVLRYFCCPVFANGAADYTKAHFHCIPRWSKPSTWIIAWPFETKRALETRWFTPEEWAKRRGQWTPGSWDEEAAADGSEGAKRIGMAFGPESTDELRDHCYQLRTSWKRQCKKDSLFALEHEKEYRVRHILPLHVLTHSCLHRDPRSIERN